jgi:microcin C transport system permease protein
MIRYIAKRLLLMIPTLLGVLFLTFAVIQFVPGGPVEQMASYMRGKGSSGEAGGSLFRVSLIRRGGAMAPSELRPD